VIEYPLEDISFREEMQAFLHRLEGRGGDDLATAQDCLRLLRLIEGVYASEPVTSAAAVAAVSR
jgi:hypothetical protein